MRTDPDSKAKLLLTESDAADFDLAKKKRVRRNKCLRRLAQIELSEDDYIKEEQRLGEQFGRSDVSPGDVFWGLANQRLAALADPLDAHNLKMTYWIMGLHLLDEGRKHEEIQDAQRESHQWALAQIDSFNEMGISTTQTTAVISARCCDTCNTLDGKEFTFGEVDEPWEQILPQAQCENDWCTCMWSGKNTRPDVATTTPRISASGSPTKADLQVEEDDDLLANILIGVVCAIVIIPFLAFLIWAWT